MKRLIALVLVLALTLGCLAGVMAEEQLEDVAAVQEEVVSQENNDSEEEPAEQTAEEPAEQPAEEPVEQPVEQPAEEPTEEPAEEPAEEPVEQPVEQPAEESAEEPAEKPAEEPAEEFADEPAEKPVEKPAKEPAEEPDKEPEEELRPDRTMVVGEEADCVLSADRPYVIRLQGIAGEVWIEAEADFTLKMEITDEADSRKMAFNGNENEPLVAVFSAQAGRTYLISVDAVNGRAGAFHILVSKQEAEDPVAEDVPAEESKPEQQDDNGGLVSNDGPKTVAAATLKIPSIKKITQTNDSVTVTWTAVTGAQKYRIYCKKGSGTWKLLATVTGQKKTSYTHKTKVVASTSGVTLRYKVCALGAGGAKSKYSAKSIIRLAAPGPVKLKKSTATEDKVFVSWQKVKGAKKYYVYYKLATWTNFKLKKVSGSSTSTSIPVTGTKEHKVYVVAVADDSASQRSAVKSITPYWYRVYLVGEYYYYDGNNPLWGVYYDVDGMYDLFKKQTDEVYYSYNASASTILSNISSIFGGASPNTVCVFMYSGHGYTGYGYSSGALACSDGSYITTSTLKYTMDSLNINDIVILLGSCGSGGFIDPNGEEKKAEDFNPDAFNRAFVNAFRAPASNAGEFKEKGYTVIAAAAAHENGWCSWWENSYGSLVNGGTDIMRALAKAGGYEYCTNSGKYVGSCSKAGDSNKDKVVTVKEAYTYAKKQVKRSHVQYFSKRANLILFQ